jgi:hypothetical protein
MSFEQISSTVGMPAMRVLFFLLYQRQGRDNEGTSSQNVHDLEINAGSNIASLGAAS